MGRNKIKIEKIENSKIRQVTFYKRKRGLLKKAMELSLLCDSKIFLCIVDKVEKLTIYSSENDINKFLSTYIQKLNHSKVQKDILSNHDYKTLFINSANSSEDKTFPEDPSERTNQEYDTKICGQINEENQERNTHCDEKFFGFNTSENYEHNPFQSNEKDSEINIFLNNTLFEDDGENGKYKLSKTKKEEEEETNPPSRNMNNIFSAIFSTDNNSVSSSNANSLNTQRSLSPDGDKKNLKCIRVGNLQNKRPREECKPVSSCFANQKPNTQGETVPNQNINFAVINPQSLANLQNLFPNLNMLSQNIGVVNWVLPVSNVNEEN